MWWIAAGALLIGGGLLVRSPIVLQALGDFLIVRDPPAPADAVIAIGGDGEERVQTAAALLAGGYGRWLIISGGPGDDAGSAIQLMAYARRHGVAPDRILLDDTAVSTWQNAVASAQLMRRHGLRTALLVTSPYHMRRSIVAFRKAFRPEGLVVRAAPVEDSFFDVHRWWTRRGERRVVLREYGKLLALLIGVR